MNETHLAALRSIFNHFLGQIRAEIKWNKSKFMPRTSIAGAKTVKLQVTTVAANA